MTICFRPYERSDKDALLRIFQSNAPRYFATEDLPGFADYLERMADRNYQVVLMGEEIVGCGGHHMNPDHRSFGIAWVMFKRHALGLSRFGEVSQAFFQRLISNIRAEGMDYDVVINTTQLLEKTLYRFGFLTERVIPGGFGTGLDHYVMRLKSSW
jgi:hypothetical protein